MLYCRLVVWLFELPPDLSKSSKYILITPCLIIGIYVCLVLSDMLHMFFCSMTCRFRHTLMQLRKESTSECDARQAETDAWPKTLGYPNMPRLENGNVLHLKDGTPHEPLCIEDLAFLNIVGSMDLKPAQNRSTSSSSPGPVRSGSSSARGLVVPWSSTTFHGLIIMEAPPNRTGPPGALEMRGEVEVK